MKTALITHADCLDHVTPAGHPEQVARLEHVLHALAPLDLNRVTAPLAADDDLLRIHPKSYIDEIKQMRPDSGTFQVDADTYISPGSVDAAYRAAGGALRAVDMVLRGEAKNAFFASPLRTISTARNAPPAARYAASTDPGEMYVSAST